MNNIIYLAVNWVDYPRGSQRSHLQNIAAQSWLKINELHPNVVFVAIGEQKDLKTAPEFMQKAAPLHRSSSDVINDNKRLPFLRDILRRLVEYPDKTSPSDWYGYLNSDIILKRNFMNLFNNLDAAGFTSIICRADEINIVSTLEEAHKAQLFTLELSGRDLFMFKYHGASKLLSQLPDYLIGKPAWDLDAYRILMKETKMHDDIDSAALTIHMDHERTWRSNESIGSRYNQILYCLKYRLNAPNADGFYTTHMNR